MANKKLDTLLTFTTQFASMSRAHIPLVKSIDNLSKDMIDKNFATTLKELSSDVKKGVDLSDSMKKHPKVFDAIYINMVKAGMESGKLHITLTQLSNYLSKASQTANKVNSALTYPKFLGIAMILIVLMMLNYVVPMFQKIYSKNEELLPVLTKYLIAASHFVQNNFGTIIIVLISIYAVLKIFFMTNFGNRVYDYIKIKMPYLGELNKKSSISRFIRTLGVLAQSDVPMLKAIELSKSSSSNILIEEKIEIIVHLVQRGYAIAEAFKQVKIFPDIVIQMISSGEEGGNLDELLINSADYYDDQVDNELKSVVSLINPFMTVILGGVVALLMLAIYMPIFDMGKTF